MAHVSHGADSCEEKPKRESLGGAGRGVAGHVVTVTSLLLVVT